MKKYTLIEALIWISQIKNIPVEAITAIQYEDGSGCTFMYTTLVNFKSNEQFIDLRLYRITN